MTNTQSGGAQEFSFLAEALTEVYQVGWIIDLGASEHLCGHRKDFTTYTHISKVHAITIADGTKIEAVGKGNIEIETEAGSIILIDVGHGPNI